MPLLPALLLVSVLLAQFGTSAYSQQFADKKLVIYSGRKAPLINRVLDLYELKTGVRIILKSGKSAALGQQILHEQSKPVADVYLANDAGSLEFLRRKGILLPLTEEAVEAIPSSFRAEDGSWIGLSGRARAILYNKSLVKESEVPRSVFALTDSRWKGKIAATDAGNESFTAWVSALRLTIGEEKVKQLLQDLKNNEIQLISSSHTDVRKAVGRGEFPIGLINHYYYHLQRHEPRAELANVGIVYPDQSEEEIGTLVNVAGVAVLKGAPHLESATGFVSFLLSTTAQRLFAEKNFEFPLMSDVPTHSEVQAELVSSSNCQEPSLLDCLKLFPVRLDQLGAEMQRTQTLLDEVNWY